MHLGLDGENLVIPETCSPKTVEQFSGFGVFLDAKRFPVQSDWIDDMADYFDVVNAILLSGGVLPISLGNLIDLQSLLSHMSGQSIDSVYDMIIELEETQRNMALWLHFYLELRDSEILHKHITEFPRSVIHIIDAKRI